MHGLFVGAQCRDSNNRLTFETYIALRKFTIKAVYFL